jgi:hypothetical protein
MGGKETRCKVNPGGEGLEHQWQIQLIKNQEHHNDHSYSKLFDSVQKSRWYCGRDTRMARQGWHGNDGKAEPRDTLGRKLACSLPAHKGLAGPTTVPRLSEPTVWELTVNPVGCKLGDGGNARRSPPIYDTQYRISLCMAALRTARTTRTAFLCTASIK